jgi:secondary thiamine-phosphate synthase enzyme
MLFHYSLRTEPEGFINITRTVEESLAKSGVKDGICVVFCPHTTAGITINENADPDVRHDLLLGFPAHFPTVRNSCMRRETPPRI